MWYSQNPPFIPESDAEKALLARLGNAEALRVPLAQAGIVEKVDALHRMLPQQARDALTKAGFTIEAESPLLANPSDDHTKNVFDPAVRGHTDQFMFRARKPQ